MKKKSVANRLAIAAQLLILIAAPGLTAAQSPAPQTPRPSALSRSQDDPYAAAFAGLTFSDAQKQAIAKIRDDIDSRKKIVLTSDKLNADQKEAMLTGYTRIEYSRIYEELTPEQKKLVSTRMHARRAADPTAQKRQVPTQ
jgi:Spy/CpxP family protein refolding chaperone